ncbi:MAG: hypothetical protein J6Q03_08630 [Paludibacteraceae bacterium]|nr:hypothetical protein [Paludibacteraceae bacterium]
MKVFIKYGCAFILVFSLLINVFFIVCNPGKSFESGDANDFRKQIEKGNIDHVVTRQLMDSTTNYMVSIEPRMSYYIVNVYLDVVENDKRITSKFSKRILICPELYSPDFMGFHENRFFYLDEPVRSAIQSSGLDYLQIRYLLSLCRTFRIENLVLCNKSALIEFCEKDSEKVSFIYKGTPNGCDEERGCFVEKINDDWIMKTVRLDK